MTAVALDPHALERLTRHVSVDEIPPTEDLFSAAELAAWLSERRDPGLDLLVGGDVMLGGRAKALLIAHGRGYPFAAVQPLIARAAVTLANLEGPLARRAARQERRFSYRVAPETAAILAASGISLVTLANNHLFDCGAEGVIETLEALKRAGVKTVGAGIDRAAAHAPAVFDTPNGRLGVLGYYWNRRCAATGRRPGGAMDDAASLDRDIRALRREVDCLVVTSHWGVPYERAPGPAERERARLAIALGADAVIAHHPHVIQPFELYRGRPIFYSVGNLAFGSGNSKAEGLAIGLRFDRAWLTVEIYPLYVKNRDPRVAYQPKVMRGPSARRQLSRLLDASQTAGALVEVAEARAVLRVPRSFWWR
jgi:poly-gamma-glutamate capsule biosynthesis protein CapA/YwtB (metallophosphatase superfamily)